MSVSPRILNARCRAPRAAPSGGAPHAQRALARHSRPAREAGRRGRNLAHYVQMAVLGGGERLDGQHVAHSHAHLFGRGGARGLLGGVACPLPGDQDAALAQQRRRVLDQQRERAHGPGRDRVVGLPTAAKRGRYATQLLRARGYGARTGHIARLDQPVHDRGLAPRRFHEVNLCLRQSHRQDQPRKACTCADIGDPLCPDQLGNLQPAQAVCHMNLQRRLRLAHRGVRVRLCCEGLENALDLRARGLSQPVAGD